MRRNRIALHVESIPFDRADAQEVKDQQLAHLTTCEHIIAVNGQLFCGIDQIDWTLVESGPSSSEDDHSAEDVNELTYPFDRIHPSSQGTTNVIVYSNPLLPSFRDLHTRMVEYTGSKKIRYILRVCSVASSTPLFIQGFEVELAIKNMEYKVLDDSKIAYDSDDTSNVELPSEFGDDSEDEKDVSGFYFERLIQRRPELAKELNELKATLLRETSSEEEKKVAAWDMKDLGYQCAQRVLTSKHPLEVLRDLSQNFPMYAQALTKTRVNATIKAGIDLNVPSHHGPHSMLPPAGTTILDLNGVTLDLTQAAKLRTLEIRSMIETLFKSEARSIDTLRALDLTPESIANLFGLRLAPEQEQDETGESKTAFLLDMGTHLPETQAILTWYNDITTDPRYRQWPPSVMELLQPGQMKYIRKNLYTAVMIVDPSTSKGLDFLAQAHFFIQQNAPMRFGFIFWIPPHSTKSKTPTWNSELLGSKDAYEEIIGEENEDDRTSSSTSSYNSIQATIAKVFHHLVRLQSPSYEKNRIIDWGMQFLHNLHEMNMHRRVPVTVQEVESVYSTLVKKQKIKKAKRFAQVMSDSNLDEYVQRSIDYVAERGFVPDGDPYRIGGQMPLFVMNGVIHRASNERIFRELMMHAFFNEQKKMTMKVYQGVITDRTPDIHRVLQTGPNVYPRISSVVTSKPIFLTSDDLPSLTVSRNEIAYFTSPDPEIASEPTTITYWHVARWDTPRGLAQVDALLTYLAKGHGDIRSRVTFIQLPTKSSSIVSRLGSALFHAPSTSTLSYERKFVALRELIALGRYFFDRETQLARAVDKWIETNTELAFLRGAIDLQPNAMNGGKGLNPGFTDAMIEKLQTLVPPSSKDQSSEILVANGRVMDLAQLPLEIMDDLRLISSFITAQYGLTELGIVISDRSSSGSVRFLPPSGSTSALTDIDRENDPAWLSEVIARVSMVLAARTAAVASKAGSGLAFPSYNPDNRAGLVHLPNDKSPLKLRVVLDPVSKVAQTLSAVLLMIRDLFEPDMRIWLNPKSGITEFPIKRFYRYALTPSLSFDETTGALKSTAGATFRNLRTRHVLSTVVFTPESWSVVLEKAKPDLDNLRVEEFGDAVIPVQYRLQHLLMYGQCFDTAKGEPPAGLQLMLTSKDITPSYESVTHYADTLVMANLGFFQLKAAPGEWTLSIADPAHADIFELQQPASSTQSSRRSREYKLFVRGWTEGFIKLDVARKSGKEMVPLLDVQAIMRARVLSAQAKKAETSGGGGGLFAALFGGSDDTKQVAIDPLAASESLRNKKRSGETIHIFSLASGHLYERFLKIMMLSVLHSTSHPLKFWFLQNFASPQFIEFVPQMAKQLGFEAEFVTYKWPLWLRAQEEKQRIIWGYKILFLDVLFPLNVPRVIYIDSDQVVRGDIAELWHMDLQGAPYAYTPFCDSNKDTEGFRFWKQGYWKDHLRGKPYHISALYVVDLDIFRGTRAGDTLRQIYDQLSADPNSLANLDQDLPNFAQHMVPIHSLPQSWLWCQTWCSMETLPKAKTIDLCNNPLTKTPKLEVAKSLLPEWTTLDEEAKEVELHINQHQTQHAKENPSQQASTQTKSAKF